MFRSRTSSDDESVFKTVSFGISLAPLVLHYQTTCLRRLKELGEPLNQTRNKKQSVLPKKRFLNMLTM